MSSVNIKNKIDRKQIKVHIHGNLVSDIGDLFTGFFKKQIADAIEDAMHVALHDALPALINKWLVSTDGYLPFPEIQEYDYDWSTLHKMQVKKNWMGLGMKGLMDYRPKGEWEEDPFPVPANMPLKDHDRPDKFQNWLSSYTINGFLESITEAANLGLNAPSTLTGMTCGKVSALLPGISEAYGADTPVDIKIGLNKIGDFAVTEKNSQMSAVSDLDL